MNYTLKRSFAVLVDMLIIDSIIFLIGGLIIYFHDGMIEPAIKLLIGVGTTIWFIYYAFLPSKFNSFIGKRIWGLKVSGQSQENISFFRHLIRVIPLGLWPINLLLIMIRKDKRHLGDLLANAHVESYRKIHCLKPFIYSIIVCILTFYIAESGFKIGLIKNESYIKAKSEATRFCSTDQLSFSSYKIVDESPAYIFNCAEKEIIIKDNK